MSKDANSFGHDKALAWESRGFVYTKKRMHRFDTPSFIFNFSYPKSCGHKAGFTDVNELSDSFRFGIVFRQQIL